LSSLFERVIVASGTSNRQTKALASSVRDKVREGGFGKPRIEGEDNGEWIIVDCGPVVAHIMQPAIRQYYNLEEIWGEKAVRLKHGADKKVAPAKTTASKAKPKAAATQATQKPAAAKTRTRTSASPAGAAKGAARSSAAPARKRAPAAQGAATPSAARAVAKKSTSARKTPTRSATAPSAARKA